MSSARRGFGQHSPGKLVCASMASCTVHHKKSPDRSRIPVDIPTGWEPPWPYGLHLLIFPQPLGRALKNQNAAPTTPPCFCRRQRSSSLLFESCTVHHKKSPDRMVWGCGGALSTAVEPLDEVFFKAIMIDAFLIHRTAAICCPCLDFIEGVSHGNACADCFQHFNVVSAIPKGNSFCF